MPVDRGHIQEAAAAYSRAPVVGCVGSHSALDIADGAATEGLRSLVLAQGGREATYARYFRTHRDPSGQRVRGCVDDVWTFPSFADVVRPPTQQRLREGSVLLVPNRALSSYVPIAAIEDELEVPIVGSRRLLRIEERTERENYYTLLESAGIPTPPAVASPEAIDGLCMVKLPHASRRLERGFFTVASPSEFRRKSGQLIDSGTITRADLESARIERYVIGPVFNFNFFFSPLVPRDDGLE
ncbi:MAG: DUF1246 domain-containing protein, partial [Thermoplasmata archaeon]|nr:DUF1246 domain-containing protein [Thermoplasmata archaeon]